MPSLIYDNLKGDLANGRINLAKDTLKIMLVTSTYKPAARHSTTAAIDGETAGPGYKAGGQALNGAKVDDAGRLDASPVCWDNATITARGAVLYKAEGGRLIAFFDFGKDMTAQGGDFKCPWPDGLLG